MQNDNLKSYLHLHVIVFIWGFTAILGKLISLEALDLVWYRMLFASVIMTFVVLFNKEKIKVPFNVLIGFIVSGIIIAAHWLTFYQAIKVSNVSITLACLSTGAFFASILEPIFYKRRVIWYELLFGIIVVVGLGIIFNVETKFKTGIYLAVTSAFLSALFSVINGKYAKEYDPNVISLYELSSGVFFLSIYLFFAGSFTPAFFSLSVNDLIWLFLLSSICTAYAFSASVKVMKFLSPFTVMLTINLEPIYGIILALLIFKDGEEMSPLFYVGALIILATVIANGIVKSYKKVTTN
ncbi:MULTISPECIES: DMT family transporter [Flavobacterium]|jgi:drug/metabolite transporter (DMT)-like permease|uniref:EamA domain-containing membrane protein RarD n=2 Tax=Flavobacterium TaxID=237 RepID=A0A562KC16_9FLAO|nr:DMT family transporter [Flavobacterium cheniae]TDR18559.1 EamA domain-containing membrane protein RarD [Flavobacterium cheniae]TWH92959.1 EamA domain-containing membrane protein RarD [Flavobacterium cheniae]